jgi:hypothetical protein
VICHALEYHTAQRPQHRQIIMDAIHKASLMFLRFEFKVKLESSCMTFCVVIRRQVICHALEYHTAKTPQHRQSLRTLHKLLIAKEDSERRRRGSSPPRTPFVDLPGLVSGLEGTHKLVRDHMVMN